MRLRFKIVLVAFLVLVGAIVVFFLRPGDAEARATLRFDGYRIDTNQTKKASFTLTNPASIAVGYTISKEIGGSNTLLHGGTLRNGNIVSLQVPVSQTPTRLMVHCHREGWFREHLNDLRNMIGLRQAAQSAEYTLTSEPFHE